MNWSPTWLQTEIGIYESFVITDRTLCDQTVVNSLETLITRMRLGSLPPLSGDDVVEYQEGQEEDLVIGSIRSNWARHFEGAWRPSTDQLIGILRTILGSIDTMRAPGPQSQSYLRHIEGFLTKKIGVSVKPMTGDMRPLPEPEEDEFVRLGRRWIQEDDDDVGVEFRDLANYLMESGEASRVIDGCHLLIGEESDPTSKFVVILSTLSLQARDSLVTAMG